MAHITLPEGAPGIIGPMIAYPEAQTHLSGLAEALLRGPSSLTSAGRELIAVYVSSGNQGLDRGGFCMFNRYVDGLGTWPPRARPPTRSRLQDWRMTGM